MNAEMTQAATGAAARVVSSTQFYRTDEKRSTVVNGTLARLMFSLESPRTTIAERSTILRVLDGLIRLKIDAGLLRGCRP